MTFLHALATLWPKFKHRIPIYSNILKPANKRHRLVYVRQAFLFLIFCFTLFSYAQAQSVGERTDAGLTDIKPLQIGDTIPDALWHMPLQVVNHPEGKETITLKNYKDKKLIILDFWATWCAPCIKSFPKLDSIQREYRDDIQILLVNSLRSTRDQKEKIDFLLKNRSNPAGEHYIIPSIVDEATLKQVFPHKIMPHCVWIGREGNIASITGYDQFTQSNVLKLLSGETIASQPTDQHVELNPANRILSRRNDLDRVPKKMKGILTKHTENLPHATGTVGENELYKKIYFLNQNLLSIIDKSLTNQPIHHNRVFVDGISLASSPLRSSLLDTLYCYELTVDHPSSLDSLKLYARDDISGFTGLRIGLRDTSLDTWTVQLRDSTKIPVSSGRISDTNLLDSGSGNKYMRNLSIAAFTNVLNQIFPILVLDETGYSKKLDLDLPSDPRSISDLNRALIQQGFEIVMHRRKIRVLDIKSNN